MKYLVYPFLIFLILLESSILTIPVVLLFLLFYAVFARSETVFLIAFVSGIFLDMLLLRPLGLTSVFFLSVVFLVLLYERKFEIGTVYFVTILSFLSSLFYFLLFPSAYIFPQVVICVILSFAIFLLSKRFIAPKTNYHTSTV